MLVGLVVDTPLIYIYILYIYYYYYYYIKKKTKEEKKLVNVSFSLTPERFQKIYQKQEEERKKDPNTKISMSDIINSLIQKGLAYEAILHAKSEESKV